MQNLSELGFYFALKKDMSKKCYHNFGDHNEYIYIYISRKCKQLNTST